MRVGIIALALLLLATGCFRVDLAIEVHDDGSGTISAIQAVDTAEAQALLGQVRVPDLTPRGVSPRVKVTSYSNGAERGFRLDASFENSDGLQDRLVDVREALGSSVSAVGIDGGINSLEVTRLPASGWRFELVREDLVVGAARLLPNFDELGRMGRGVFDKVTVQVSVRLPGRAFNHNADRVENGRFIWTLTLNDERDVLFAQTIPAATASGKGGNSPWPWIVLAIGVSAVLAIGIGLAWNQRRTRPQRQPRRQPGRDGRPPIPERTQQPEQGAQRREPIGGWPTTPPLGVASPPHGIPAQPSGWPTEPPGRTGDSVGFTGGLPPPRPPDLP